MQAKHLASTVAAVGFLTLGFTPTETEAAPTKNIMLFISDGASWGTWDMASYYQYGQKGMQPYDNFSVKLGMTTYPLNTSTSPTNNSTPTIT